ncbi:ABC transporter ATP-binding protein/permease [Yinghuangia sp. ASG 101]|uniref:ABC transporter ATP-binding protein n=1 Tax=Yinghuangia sp. ASG 101 TaxID=2896848 RepID=UPI001E5B1222|nr:ABC transporter ATP-binding protein [Yinghuangia sp. ASG 101]UGQ09616.1 ABC transporter ATP-binding protein/permease [Yinghuangia sp. ASG 101]
MADPTPVTSSRSTRPAPSTVATLLRLRPFVRPARRRLIGAALTALAATCSGLTIPLLVARVVDGPVADHDTAALWPWVALLALLGAMEVFFFWARRALTARALPRVEETMRNTLYEHLQTRPVAFHDTWQSGQLLSRATRDLNELRSFLSFIVVFLFVNSATFLVGSVMLVILHPLLGLVVTAIAVPVVAFSVVFERRYRVVARRAQDQAGDVATVMEESVLGIRVLKAFGRHRAMDRRFHTLTGELRATELRKARMVGIVWAFLIAVPEIAVAVALLLGVGEVADGAMTSGELVAFFAIVMYLRWPVESLGWLLAASTDAAAAAGRYFEVLDADGELPERDRPIDPVRVAGAVAFEGVRFRFPETPPDTPDVLRGVDLAIRPGETIALVGPTGSGKTAMASLVPRLYDVTGGRIALDGVDVRDLPVERLRRIVAVAFEEPVLFSMSVRENVLLGFPEGTDDDVRRALAVAQAEFVDDLPWGLDTRVGEEGLDLSGGQRQRLALARAVVARPAVLVLDDPLSALDVHTESQVEKALRTVLATTTALVVAHRPSTVQLADRVALLANGRIEAVGTHDQLLQRSAAYRRLMAADTSRFRRAPAPAHARAEEAV